MKLFDRLAAALSKLGYELEAMLEQRRIEFEWHKSHSGLVTKQDLLGMEERIMSKITEFYTEQKAYNAAVAKAIDDNVTSHANIAQDIIDLNKKIEEAVNSPEDLALLEELKADGATLA